MTVLWLVTKDHMFEVDEDALGIPTRVGFGQTDEDLKGQAESIPLRINIHTDLSIGVLDPSKDPVQWRVLDDDGEVYYEGLMSIECFADNETCDAPLNWARADAGATDMQYRRSPLDDWAPL